MREQGAKDVRKKFTHSFVCRRGDLNSGLWDDWSHECVWINPVQTLFSAQSGVASCCPISASFVTFADSLLTNRGQATPQRERRDTTARARGVSDHRH
jgi:hypothetical protein